MLKIRLKRQGRTNRAHFRIGVYDERTARGGKCVEIIGQYDPHNDNLGVQVDQARLTHHLGNGAQLTEKCAALLKKAGVSVAHPNPSTRKRRKRNRSASSK